MYVTTKKIKNMQLKFNNTHWLDVRNNRERTEAFEHYHIGHHPIEHDFIGKVFMFDEPMICTNVCISHMAGWFHIGLFENPNGSTAVKWFGNISSINETVIKQSEEFEHECYMMDMSVGEFASTSTDFSWYEERLARYGKAIEHYKRIRSKQ